MNEEKQPKKICLISCVKTKKEFATKAGELYDGQLYNAHLGYAKEVLGFDEEHIKIISAKHGLLDFDKVIEPYEVTLNNMPTNQRNIWARKTLNQILERFDEDTHFTILAGKKYYENLVPYLKNSYLPEELKGLPIGKRVQRLNQLRNDKH